MATDSPTRLIDPVIELRDVTWQTYDSLRSAQCNGHVRMTFNQGRLYLMSPSRLHERIAELLGRFVLVWTEQRAIPIMSGGSTTMKDRLRERGLEPDKCFYIQNEAVARKRDDYDAAVDPPPDLAIEVDVTSISTVRMPIYASFGVPEIWRWVDDEIEIYRLQDAQYSLATESICLVGFPIDKTLAHLAKRHELDETSLIAAFRKSL